MRKIAFGLAVLCVCSVYVLAQAPAAVQITNGPIMESVSPNSATIAWSANTGASSVVHYGTDPNNLSQTAKSPWMKGEGTHRVKLENLRPGTTYYFRVESGEGSGTGTSAQSQVAQFMTPAAGAGDKVPLYRLTSGQGHLFTTSAPEKDLAVSSRGYRAEGIAGFVESSQSPGTVPLYRFVSSNGDHFYTTNPSEASAATGQYKYQAEGVAGYIANTQQPGTVPLHRLLAPNGNHFYTTNAAEVSQLTGSGYKDEGVTGYLWPS